MSRNMRINSLISQNKCFDTMWKSNSYDFKKFYLSRVRILVKLRYITGFGLVEMVIWTNPKPTVYHNVYRNIVARKLNDPIWHSLEWQIGLFSFEARIWAQLLLKLWYFTILTYMALLNAICKVFYLIQIQFNCEDCYLYFYLHCYNLE